MNKEHLLVPSARPLNIPIHEHHEVVGINKSALKVRIRASSGSGTPPSRRRSREAHDRAPHITG